tara:strand:+ start:594 stop:707 length:114 start_codon:yes stop_codon:yes gene_type:complete
MEQKVFFLAEWVEGKEIVNRRRTSEKMFILFLVCGEV